MLFGAIVFAGNAGSNTRDLAQQNQNSNANQNQNRNANQNANVVTNKNSNNSNTTAGEVAMSGMSSRDQKFITDKAMSGMMEVELGRWAAQKGTSEEVKAFGRRVVEDHSKVNTELKQLASAKGITLATEMDRKHQSNISKISRLTGEEFDRAFSKMMLKSHEDSVKDFEKVSTSSEDAELKAFASKVLPTLQEHLQLARALPGNAGSGGSNSNNSNSP
jgi:putative membrane protein